MHPHVKKFLEEITFTVLIERSPTHEHFEHYFFAIQKEFLNENDKNKEVFDFLSSYETKFPLKNLSNQSLDYLNQGNYHVIHIQTLDTRETFYPQNAEFVQKNAKNIIAKKMYNEYVDTTGLVFNKVEALSSMAQLVGKASFHLMKDKLRENEIDKKIDNKVQKIKKFFR